MIKVEDYSVLDKITAGLDEYEKRKFIKAYEKTIKDIDLIWEYEQIYQDELEKKRIQEQKLAEEERRRKEELLEEKRAKEEQKYMNTARRIYNKCLKLDIRNFEKEEDIKKMLVISKTFGVNDINKAKEMFDKISSEEREKERQKKLKIEYQKQKKREKIKKEEYQSFLESKKICELKGKQRYSGIYKNISDNLIDDVFDVEEYLNINLMKYSITHSKHLKVNFKCTLKKSIIILNQPGILDGSFKINIFDENSELVGEGYINGYLDKNKTGFCNSNYNAICICHNHTPRTKINYKIEVEPLYFWIMECGKSTVVNPNKTSE